MREIFSGSPIGVNFGVLLDERGHPLAAVRGLAANPVRSMNANSRRSGAKTRPSGGETRATTAISHI
ncbi:hypothetical protein, partial [Mesorhizobium sp. M4B.F.Ca.ET.089.01.1.1]|uniref:hypothetical protein n=1 Tax=Mesorhizobium sp. M4B.F.Ca.ET.089.01.1.1 TaxID=2496662 RepID=UPI001AECC41C